MILTSKSPTVPNGVNRRRIVKKLSALLPFLALAVLLLCTAFPEFLAPKDPYAQSLIRRLKPPSFLPGGISGYILGTDQLGRDILSRIIFGARVTIITSVLAVCVAAVVGTTAGLVAGYFRGRVDSAVVRAIDVQLAFPVVLLVIAIVAVIGPSLSNLIIVMGLSAWPQFARITRGAVISVRDLEYIEAARSIGAGHMRIMFRHILRNILSSIIVYATFEMARMMLVEATLSFLGLGVQPPTPTWGGMISDGSKYLGLSWSVSFFPGLVIVLAVLLVNDLGDRLRDFMDPYLKND
ncbi:ABC transporter permease [Microvirga flavescens]|uniref:ABC transporter permease n=1 Tax=Microvirga flavescens TaxID=2249811 RepID=UPI000DDB1C1F|nr:ABC transporter permease [Microvirga flavescens]